MYTRKQVVTCVSIVYLILVTALAAYASSRATKLSIPISDVLTGFATVLPIVAGLLLEGGYDFNRLQERRNRRAKGSTPRPPIVIIANTLVLIYSTVVITLLGTHIAPASGLRCDLKDTWNRMFRAKDAEAIKTIQDAFQCCGLMNSHDEAWPFPDKITRVDACEKRFERTQGCLAPWRAEEQRLAGILMAVVLLVFVWQFTILAVPTKKETWLHRVLPDGVSNLIADEEQGSSRHRRAIGYLPSVNNYDRVQEEVEDDEEDRQPRAIDQGVQTVRSVLPGSNAEQLHVNMENEWARS